MRRVELTHDVLCGVVKASRDQRHEREAREEAERVLDEQRAREKAARHALRRARSIAIGCILLAALALSAAGYAYLSAARAHRAERQAQRSRALAQQARGHAERLLGYLSDDFDRELESFGQLKVIAEFTQRQIDYFHSLPPQLRSAETIRNGALALIEHAQALGALGEHDADAQNTDEAIKLLEGLRRGGDRSEATLIALGRAYTARCQNLTWKARRGAPVACRRALSILQPVAERPGASVPARQAYLEALTITGWTYQTFSSHYERALRATRQAMQFASALGAQDLKNLEVSADYAAAGAWRVDALLNLDRNTEALRVGNNVLAVADRVLAQRPWYRATLHAEQLTEQAMASAAQGELDPREERRLTLAAQQAAQAFLRLDPKNETVRYDLGLTLLYAFDSLWARGHLDQAVGVNRALLGEWTQASNNLTGAFAVQSRYIITRMGKQQALSGDLPGALRTAASAQRLFQSIIRRGPPSDGEWFAVALDAQAVQAEVAYERGDFGSASRLAEQALQSLRHVKPAVTSERFARAYLLYDFSILYGHAEYRLGHFATAEHAERVALKQNPIFLAADSSVLANQRDGAEISTWLSLTLARQGKLREAAQVIDPVVKFENGLLARDHGDVWVPYELARALYAQSLAEPARRDVLLERAAALLKGLPPRLQKLHEVRQWRQWVAESGPAP